jgi:hypothetical protein
MKTTLLKLQSVVWGLLIFLGSLVLGKAMPNVLFLAVNDLRPHLGCFGQREMITPNIDNLAGQGVLFNEATVRSSAVLPEPVFSPACGSIQTASLEKVYHHLTDNKIRGTRFTDSTILPNISPEKIWIL